MLPRIVVWREPRVRKRRAGRPVKAAFWCERTESERTGSERMCTKESRPTADLPRLAPALCSVDSSVSLHYSFLPTNLGDGV